MKQSIALLLGLCLLPLSAVAMEGSPEEPLAKLDGALKLVRDSKEDVRDKAIEEVRTAVDQLTGGYKGYEEAQQKEVVKGIAKIFNTRVYEDREGGDVSGDKIYLNAAAALSDMGDEGEKVLKKALDIKSLEKKPAVRETIVEALGKHRNEKNVDMFIKMLVDDDPKLVRGAVNALGEYHESDGKLRKKIAEALVKQYANTHNLDLKEKGRNPVWRDRLTTIEVPMNESLGKLTLQNLQSAPDWEKWFNDNRNKNW